MCSCCYSSCYSCYSCYSLILIIKKFGILSVGRHKLHEFFHCAALLSDFNSLRKCEILNRGIIDFILCVLLFAFNCEKIWNITWVLVDSTCMYFHCPVLILVYNCLRKCKMLNVGFDSFHLLCSTFWF